MLLQSHFTPQHEGSQLLRALSTRFCLVCFLGISEMQRSLRKLSGENEYRPNNSYCCLRPCLFSLNELNQVPSELSRRQLSPAPGQCCGLTDGCRPAVPQSRHSSHGRQSLHHSLYNTVPSLYVYSPGTPYSHTVSALDTTPGHHTVPVLDTVMEVWTQYSPGTPYGAAVYRRRGSGADGQNRRGVRGQSLRALLRWR